MGWPAACCTSTCCCGVLRNAPDAYACARKRWIAADTCPLIRRDRCSNRGIVVDILRHHLDHLGKADQSDKSRIKPLLLGGGGQLGHGEVLVLPQPVIHIQNLLRIGGSRRDLRQ